MSGPTKVLFVCRHNAGRSQLAAGLLRAKVDPSAVVVRSRGLEPAAAINAAGAAALLEQGIDIRDQVPRKVTEADFREADVIVCLVRDLELPVPAAVAFERWDLPDPAVWDVEHLRPLIDDIDRRVTALAAHLTDR